MTERVRSTLPSRTRPVRAGARTAPVPRTAPEHLSAYVRVVEAPDGDHVGWRFDWPAVLGAGPELAGDAWGRFVAWQETYETQRDLGSTYELDRFGRWAQAHAPSPQLAALIRDVLAEPGGSAALDPEQARTLRGELGELAGAMSESGDEGWAIVDRDRPWVIVGTEDASQRHVVRSGVDWQIALDPDDGLVLVEEAAQVVVKSLERVGKELLLDTGAGPVLSSSPAAHALAEIAAACAAISVVRVGIELVHARAFTGLLTVADAAVAGRTWMVVQTGIS